MPSETPEPPHRRVLAEILHQQQQNSRELTALRVHAPGQPDTVVLALPSWQTRESGVRTYHVPHPDRPGLFLAVYAVESGAGQTETTTDESRLALIAAGEIELNGRQLRAGQSAYLAPGEPSTWRVVPGASLLAVVLFDAPPPEIALSIL